MFTNSLDSTFKAAVSSTYEGVDAVVTPAEGLRSIPQETRDGIAGDDKVGDVNVTASETVVLATEGEDPIQTGGGTSSLSVWYEPDSVVGQVSTMVEGERPEAADELIASVRARDVQRLEIQIVALPRVFNLTRREADMVVSVSQPESGRVLCHKIADYRLHLAASEDYLARAGAPRELADLKGHRIIGYIPDMIFDRELDYLAALGVEAPPIASNSVSVQLNLIRQGAGLGVVHDFALPFAPGVRRVLSDAYGLRRAFHLIRHVDDRHVPRLERFAAALIARMRAEITRLEALAERA